MKPTTCKILFLIAMVLSLFFFGACRDTNPKTPETDMDMTSDSVLAPGDTVHNDTVSRTD